MTAEIHERLLSLASVARRLDVDERTVRRRLVGLQAKGLQVVQCGRFRRVREESLNRLIKRAAEREEPLF